MACVHPSLQRELLRAQSLGSADCLDTVLCWIELNCAACKDLLGHIRATYGEAHRYEKALQRLSLSGQAPFSTIDLLQA
jgi:hypothetical protein